MLHVLSLWQLLAQLKQDLGSSPQRHPGRLSLKRGLAEADLSDPLNRLVVNNDEPLTAPVAPRPALQDLDWP